MEKRLILEKEIEKLKGERMGRHPISKNEVKRRFYNPGCR